MTGVAQPQLRRRRAAVASGERSSAGDVRRQGTKPVLGSTRAGFDADVGGRGSAAADRPSDASSARLPRPRPRASRPRGEPRFPLSPWTEVLRDPWALVDAAPVCVFRLCLGPLLAWHTALIPLEYFYVAKVLFKFRWVHWVVPLPFPGLHVVLLMMYLASFFVTIGVYSGPACWVWGVLWTYVFLLDRSLYQNHYYLLCWLIPVVGLLYRDADSWLSVPWLLAEHRRRQERGSGPAPSPVPRGSTRAWKVFLLRFMFCVPYFYGGVAKINADWLAGEPMRHWMYGNTLFGLPLLSLDPYIPYDTLIMFMSVSGLLLDLYVPVILLFMPALAPFALFFGSMFHLMNSSLFSIGIFPWLMLSGHLLFLHHDTLRRYLKLPSSRSTASAPLDRPFRRLPRPRKRYQFMVLLTASLVIIVHMLLPLRHFLIPGEVSWTEEGHEFAWHMKLRDKSGMVYYEIVQRYDNVTLTHRYAPERMLVYEQLGKIAAHPELLRQFAVVLAQHARDVYELPSPEVYAFACTSLNFWPYQWLVDPTVDLSKQPERTMFQHMPWVNDINRSLPPTGYDRSSCFWRFVGDQASGIERDNLSAELQVDVEATRIHDMAMDLGRLPEGVVDGPGLFQPGSPFTRFDYHN